MSKFCETRFTSVTPNCSMAAVSSYSFPNPQLPTVFPDQSSGDSIPESAHDTMSVPDRWNT